MRCFCPLHYYLIVEKGKNMGGVKITFHTFLKCHFLRNRINAVRRCKIFTLFVFFARHSIKGGGVNQSIWRKGTEGNKLYQQEII